jgi:Uma2 family endonuclease
LGFDWAGIVIARTPYLGAGGDAAIRESRATPTLRYEFDGVGPVAMTGASVGHATIQANLAIALVGRLRGTPCRFYGSDLKIQVANDHIRYPDGMVACSPADRTAKLVRDPVVIFEV